MSLAKTLLLALIFWPAVYCTSGCSHVASYLGGKVDKQDRAVQIVWNETYGRKDKPPLVRWVRQFNCDSDVNGRPGWIIWTMEGWVCREGYTVIPTQVEVALRDDDTFSSTTLAHELMHAAHLRMGVLDPYHHLDVWRAGGAVERANNKLVEEGL